MGKHDRNFFRLGRTRLCRGWLERLFDPMDTILEADPLSFLREGADRRGILRFGIYTNPRYLQGLPLLDVRLIVLG
jgi:hypothetical protein